jgi:hypothetical protein
MARTDLLDNGCGRLSDIAGFPISRRSSLPAGATLLSPQLSGGRMSDEPKTTTVIGHGVRRLCVAVDLERYSQRPDAAQVEAQRAMTALMREAGHNGALERAQWIIQPQGDGELALLPPGIDEAYVITSLVHQVSAGLHLYNRFASTAARLRMRVAVHEGLTYVAESGFAGDAINTVCRLRDAHETKDALRATKNDMVLVASARIFDDVVRGADAYELPAAEFQETEIVMADKGFRAQAYIYSGPVASGPADPAPAGGQRGQETAAGGATFDFGEHATVNGGVAGRDIHHHAPTRDTATPIYRVRDE